MTSNPEQPSTDTSEKKSFVSKNNKELAWSLIVAVIAAVILKFVLFEMFKIPSGSMEPMFHGRVDGGDRVLCTKINYLWRKPERWEIFVFEFPYDPNNSSHGSAYAGQNFIKRCVGLPGDELMLLRGDVYIKDKSGYERYERQVKPDSVQRNMWVPVYHEDFGKLKAKDLRAFWKKGGQGNIKITPRGSLQIDGGKGTHLTYLPHARDIYQPLSGIPDRHVRRQVVTFLCKSCNAKLNDTDSPVEQVKTIWDQKIADYCYTCGEYMLEDSVKDYQRRSSLFLSTFENNPPTNYTEGDDIAEQKKGRRLSFREQSWHYVPDLRFTGRLKFSSAEGESRFVISMSDEGDILDLTLAPTEEKTIGNVWLSRDGTPLDKDATAKLDLGKWHDIEFYKVDGVARVFIDGQKILEHAILTQQKLKHPRNTSLLVSAYGSPLELDDIKIDADVYYFGQDSNTYDHVVSKNGYFALGDNCPASYDSRGWGDVPEGNLRGPALLKWWPPHRIGLIK